eukprot:1137106-Pelagomonas_calceolata.AAC.1
MHASDDQAPVLRRSSSSNQDLIRKRLRDKKAQRSLENGLLQIEVAPARLVAIRHQQSGREQGSSSSSSSSSPVQVIGKQHATGHNGHSKHLCACKLDDQFWRRAGQLESKQLRSSRQLVTTTITARHHCAPAT